MSQSSYSLGCQVSLCCFGRKLQMEFPELKKKYLGRHFSAIGFKFWSRGIITDEM